MKFKATLDLHGKTATGIKVPQKVVDALDGGKKPAVTVTFNGHTYRSHITPMGGHNLIPVSAEIRSATGTKAGDMLNIEVELDTAPRTVTVPADLAKLLKTNKKASDYFASLAFSHQRAYVDWIESAKKPETRTKRISDAIAMLTEGKKR